jgi:phospholipid/cholesterol/gamma-HCH transport system ATP-binding protein
VRREMPETPLIEIRQLTMMDGAVVVQRGLDFEVRRGQIFAIAGDTGAGKRPLLRHLLCLERPAAGQILYSGTNPWTVSDRGRRALLARIGVLFDGGALLSTKTLIENVALKVRLHARLSDADVHDVAALKLAMVGLRGFEHCYPHEVDRRRRFWASMARAMSLDPEIVFFEEPSARLDPIAARRVDDIVRQLRDDFGATVVLASSDVTTLTELADDMIFLDSEQTTMTARGNPAHLRDHADDWKVRIFLRGGRP